MPTHPQINLEEMHLTVTHPPSLSLRDDLETLLVHLDILFPPEQKFPPALNDTAVSTATEAALAATSAADHLITTFNLPAGTPLTLADRKTLARHLCTSLFPQSTRPWLDQLAASAAATSGYRIAYLAQLLAPMMPGWFRRYSPRPAFAVAALLLERATTQAPPAANYSLDVADTLDLPPLVAFILGEPLHTAKALLNALDIDTYGVASYLRPLTAAERRAGIQPFSAGERRVDPALPPGYEHQAVDALLCSPAFERWAERLAGQAGWSVEAQAWPANRALGVQSIVETLYPIADRKPGQIMGFELFPGDYQPVSFREIRIDLTNHILDRLGCRLVQAQVAMHLLLRSLAPELLIDDAPEQWAHRPDLQWVSLRLGTQALLGSDKPLSFAAAMSAMEQAMADGEPAACDPKRFSEVAWEWALINQVIDPDDPQLDDPQHFAEQHLLQALTLERLAFPPDRVQEAARRLLAAGVTGDQLPDLTRRYLESSGPFELAAPSRQVLGDINPWFDAQFDAYLLEARGVFESAIKRLLALMPSAHAQRLKTLPGTAYALAWPHYRREGPAPGFGDSPEEMWEYVTATDGVLVHLADTTAQHVYELFPEKLAFRYFTLSAEQTLDCPETCSQSDLLLHHLNESSPVEYLGHPLPYRAADFPRLCHATPLAGDGTSAALEALYGQHVALANQASLRAVARGLTPTELALERQRSRSNAEYAWSLIKATVPLASCFDVQTAGDAASCAFDGVTGLGAAVRAASASIKAGHRLLAAGAAFKATRYRDIARIHSAWAAAQPTAPIPHSYRALRRVVGTPQPNVAAQALVDGHLQEIQQGTPARLIESSAAMPYGPALEHVQHTGGGWVSTQSNARPGLTPGAFALRPTPYNEPTVVVQGMPPPRQIFRGDGVADLLVNNRPYRYRYGQAEGRAVRVDHNDLPGATTSPYQMPEPGPLPYPAHPSSASLALCFHLKPVAYDLPFTGQKLSRAFMARRIETVPAYYRSGDINEHLLGQVFVIDNRLVSYVDHVVPAKGHRPASIQGKKLEAIAPGQAPVRLNLPGAIRYRDQLDLHLTSEFEFGLQASVPVSTLQAFARDCPVVRLGSFVQGIRDRRTLRALIVNKHTQPQLVVEADTGVFYATSYREPAWYSSRVDALANGPSATVEQYGPLRLSRTRDTELINAYLDASETYRVVATRSTLDSDISNITTLLADWILHRRAIHHGDPTIALDDLMELNQADLVQCAQNILARGIEQDILVGSSGRRLTGLVRSIIPDWAILTARPPLAQQQHIETLTRLLPVTGRVRLPALPVLTPERIATQEVVEALRLHLGGANLAYAKVVLRNGEQRVYYALSGGRAHRALVIAPNAQAGTAYIDARAIMTDLPPDTRFTELPVLRGAPDFRPHDHSRGLDSERMIASVINRDLLLSADQVQSIDVFSLFDTCRSCGGFVLPRLRLDYPEAQFSISWLIPYG
ncbi:MULTISPECIES: deaminase domain-containing protein [unclassified Pseudomonas]|uniref:deaminase domain-containing protein n=1 Tax=unclassified Pseudomonas TaxID=196821 RepID=UPI000BC74548|nr:MULTISPECIES: deaminase domain-containing protein [unclassified Pseudomonas]PVZ16247.1 putative deaminase of polymorphic toxin system [Pseudomonas sp. URIL14HWK12:I12]PVZ25897.1 putative deaminase of polymorphic toxin system [Pseudomonas sp. URIL14HWK12:I10]PVZ36579.1 putative deaminase of polymorphic toxin system [Pseudomonas sp. URIL14HWK12:I11]SNZ13110.1 The BURPS668_1122 family of deaminases [Pseudomonas sp. URIL14HWK12:I9]